MTPPRLVDAAGRPFPLDRPLTDGAGGEGAVWSLPGSPGMVAKVYHPGKGATAEKLSALIGLSNPTLLNLTAWPTTILYHHGMGRQPAGFVMPRADGQWVQTLYNTVRRATCFPKAGWNFQVRAAHNLAAAFDELHRAGCLMADVNEKNVFVSSQALVRLIDCDSFQVRANGKPFLCEVGVPHYTPPELQGKSLRGLVRTENHDRFGLAVLIYQLLFVGRHPYSGVYTGKGDPSFDQLIAEYRFAQGPACGQWQMKPPPHTPTFADIPADVGGLFRRAFERGSETGTRPRPADWLAALRRLEAEIVACPDDSGHTYWKGAGRCVWCRLADGGGPEYYFGVGDGAAGFAVDEGRLQAVLRRLAELTLADFPFDRRAFAPSPRPAGRPRPPEVEAARVGWQAAREQCEQVLRVRRAAEAAEVRRAEERSREQAELLAAERRGTVQKAGQAEVALLGREALTAERQRLSDDLAEKIRRIEEELKELDRKGAVRVKKLAADHRQTVERITMDYEAEEAVAASARTERRAVAGVMLGLAGGACVSAVIGLPRSIPLVLGFGVVSLAVVWVILVVARLPSPRARRRIGEYTRLRDEAWQQHADRVRAASRDYKAKRAALSARVEQLRRQRAQLERAVSRDQLVAAVLARTRAAATERDAELERMALAVEATLIDARLAAAEQTAEIERYEQGLVTLAAQDYARRLERERSSRTRRAADAELSVQLLARDWSAVVLEHRREQQKRTFVVRDAVDDIRRLAEPYRQDVARLSVTAEAAARLRHLRLHQIADAEIQHIGPGRKRTLASQGIYTAADVEETRVRRIGGFGDQLTASLIAWRDSISRTFRFDPRAGVPPGELRTLVIEYRSRQTRLLTAIEREVAEIERLASGCAAVIERLRPAAAAVVAEDEQCQADLAVVMNA